MKREFRVVKSGSKEYEVKCVNDGCPWRVHAFKGKWKSNWKCSIVTEHTCLLSEVLPSHRNISCDFVAKQMYGFIMDNLNYEPKMIVRHIEQTYQYTISYLKAWRSLARPARQVRSPDVLTYSEGHVRAQQRAKRVRRPRGG